MLPPLLLSIRLLFHHPNIAIEDGVAVALELEGAGLGNFVHAAAGSGNYKLFMDLDDAKGKWVLIPDTKWLPGAGKGDFYIFDQHLKNKQGCRMKPFPHGNKHRDTKWLVI